MGVLIAILFASPATAQRGGQNTPTLAKSFGAGVISVGSSTTLTFVVTAANLGNSGVGFTDTLPNGLVVATPSGLSSTCGGNATAGGNSVSLANVSLTSNQTCTVVVNVTATSAGTKHNGPVKLFSDQGPGNSANANLDVIAAPPSPPTIAKSFAPSSIPLGGTSVLTFTITNPNASATLTGVAFNDPFPAGLVVATPSGLTNSCGGTLTAPAGGGSVNLSGGALAVASSCTISVTVTGTTAGTKVNTTSNVSSDNGGIGNTASASLQVTALAPPGLSKRFAPALIAVNGTSTLTLTINNPNPSTALTGVAFTDAFPAGLLVATPSGLTNSCGGVLTAPAGGGSVNLSGATLAAAASCTISINVTGTTAGIKVNTTSPVSSTNGGTGDNASAALVVGGGTFPPVITKNFAPSLIPVGGTSVLTITVVNPNPVLVLTGVAFTDTLPAGLTVPAASVAQCGGTLTTTTTSITLAGAIITGGNACTVSLTVTGTTIGTKVNTTSNVSSGNGGIGNTASASLQVTALAPPGLSKRFAPALIAVNGTSTLTLTINNPNPSTALTGIAFTDAFPAGLLVATPSGLTNSCGGALTAPAGGGSVNLSGATLAAAASCTISINVTGTTAGIKVNTTSPVSSTNGGTGDNASAALVVGGGGGGGVGLPPAIAKNFAPSLIPVGGASVLTFRIINPNPVLLLSGVAFTDVLPTGLQVANPTGLTGTCGGGAITATAGGGSVSLSGATLASSASCTFSVNVTGTTVGTLTNVTDPVTSTNGGTGNSAIASITIKVPEDSQRLRDLQLIITKLEAQTSGAAVSGAIDDAIGDGFAECAGPPMPVKANGGGLRFNFGCEEQTRPRPPGMSTKGPPEVVYVPRPLQFWADVRGSDWNTSQQTGDIRGGQINALFGVTRRLAPDLLIGAFGGYENFDYTSQLLDGRLKGDGWTAGGYFGWRFLPGLRFDASLARSVINYNGVAGTAAATFPGQRWLATASLIGTYNSYGFELEPSLKVYALMEHENGYTDNLGTTQSERNFSNGRASAGAKIAYPWQWTTTVTLKPYVGVYADYYFDRDDAALPTATPLPPIQTLQGWSARVTSGLGATLADGQRLSVDGELGGLGSNQFTVWSLRGRAAIPFDAAGLPAGAYPKAVVVTSPFHDWRSGFYFGINGGGGFARKCWDLVADVFANLPGPEGCHSPSGDTLGGQIGYRLRSANWVFGVEGQGNWANFSGSNISLLFAPDSNRTRVDAFGLITGQIGYAWNNVLLYMKGGAAVTSDSYRAFSGTTGLALASARETRWGGTVGAGVEFGFAPNWSLGVEYNHLFMGTGNVNFTDPTGAFFQTESIRQGVDIGLARLNYRFGEWGAPVAARY